ncbi:DUF397 domain-containing protein [Streptomyces sp. SCUT-3]|uniref:DUF397 domain-containing protein n=1 Tax=Streptomyces sp. SCUT-3 TaxID=2684469 RepID=UPI000CC9DBE6|nr:DUF397 domain-containing protein [Streptomyces sp. SCUT-3]PLW65686.1 DUF397 domain-containing protein [Streptomyces sp. DJ]QMV23499.1 DUF397 domain-containing protein [Streptomyces sp. SCUT-3]
MRIGRGVGAPVNLTWFKSSYSGTEGDNCVEIAFGSNAVHVRDSKDRDGGSLAFPPQAWSAFVEFAARQPTGRD